MAKDFNSTKIRAAFEAFANEHKGATMRAKEINEAVKERLGGSLGGWCVSDFALPETSHSRSKHNKPLFERIKRGWYRVIGTTAND